MWPVHMYETLTDYETRGPYRSGPERMRKPGPWLTRSLRRTGGSLVRLADRLER